MSSACLDACTVPLVPADGTARIAARPAVARLGTAGARASTAWNRVATRMQWGPAPAAAVRLDAGSASAWDLGAAGQDGGSLAAWAAASRRARAAVAREASAPPAGRRVQGPSAAPGAPRARDRASGAARAAASALVRAALAPWRAWRRERRIARGVAELRELDARLLRDLGIERADNGRVARRGGPLRR